MKNKILIVEDELLIANHIKLILEKIECDCYIGISSVAEAKILISQIDFNLVIIDVTLTDDFDGTYLGEYLLKKDTVPYIYITGSTDLITIERIKQTRPHGVIIKPFKNIDIVSSVSIVLNNFIYKKIDVLRSSDNPYVDRSPFIIKKTIEYVSKNIMHKIDVSILANIANWSEQHYIREFNKYMGTTPYQYILEMKIEKSKILLIETNISTTNIAYDLGFSSYSNFCNAFKKITGKSPNKFKREIDIYKMLD